MITIIGTGHVFDLKDALHQVFSQKNPDVLCIELDQQRYHAIKMKKLDPKQYKESSKNLPILYRILAQFQENMAKRFGVVPGEEMITTIEYAKMHQIPLVCIDMNAQKLFQRMIKSMSLREKIGFLFSGIGSIVVKTDRLEKQVEDISKNVDSYLDLIGNKFPTIKKILIDERNLHMVDNLKKLMENHVQIIAIVGDGHIPGMSSLLNEKNIDHDLIRLHELQQIKRINIDSNSASFHIEYQI